MNAKTKISAGANEGRTGFALVLTLIMLLLAAVTVIAFMTTTVTERTTAVAYGRIDKADLFAQAGVEAATARLVAEMTYRPYHAIGYRVVDTGLNKEVVPVITGPRTTNPSTPTYNTAPGPDVYLVSTVDPAGTDPPGSTAPTGLTNTNSVDLNKNNLSTEPNGWIGSPTTGTRSYRAPWIDIRRDPSQAEQPDPGAANYNPVIGRYAYWIEDETSKLDVSQIGNKENGGAFLHGDGVDLPSNVPPKLAVNDLDLGAVPLVGGSSLPPGDVPTNSGIIDFRSNIPILDARFLNRAGGALTSNVHETTKFYETVFGLSNDLAGNGRRRANINALVRSPANSTSAVQADQIAGNIDDIIYVISGKHLLNAGFGPSPSPDSRAFKNAPDNYLNALVNFGLRFFASPTPTSAQQTIYLQKVAANIRDYIDTDSQPTIMNNDPGYTVRAPAIPTNAIRAPGGGTSGSNEVIAIGKERMAFMQEYAFRVRQLAFSPRTGPSANYTISIDHYLEFWNPSNRDIALADLGPNPFLLIFNQPGWDAGDAALDIPEGAPRDIRIPLSSVTPALSFPAGAVVVITTDPQPLAALAPNAARIYYAPISANLRTYSGQTKKKNSDNYLRLNLKTRTTISSDYETEIALANDFGILESAWGAGCLASGMSINIDDSSENRFDTSKWHFLGGFLRGNIGATAPESTRGDSRTNAEQMRFDLNSAAAVNDKTRYRSSNLNSASIYPTNTSDSTLTAPNANFVNPAVWPDYSSTTPSAAAAPMVIANASLTSVGQLGDIFDPARVIGDSNDITLSRSGGRTLRIGQRDDLVSGTRFATDWFNSAWRLTDLFETGPVGDPTQPPAASEMVAPTTSRGKINVNGVLRDSIDLSGNPIRTGGVAFRAALRGFNFLLSPNGDPTLSGRTLSNLEVDSLISNIQDYLIANGPIMERGEISQLPFFNTGSMSTINDRGREEIFRRTIETITTRSAAFTVYAIGEAIRQDKSGSKTTVGQKRLAITFQVEPQINGAPLQSSTAPYDAADSYRVRKIYAPN
jgi:hypothetical protein